MSQAPSRATIYALVHEVAERYGVLLAPDLLLMLLKMDRDPVEVVGEILEYMPTVPVVLTCESVRRMR